MSSHALAARGAPRPSLAEVFRVALCSRTDAPRWPPHHWKVVRAIVACRTPALGGHLYRCDGCGGGHFVPHSCRNRHCPACQGGCGARWMEKQSAMLLPAPYFHVVFTLPHSLNALVAQNQAALYKLLFDAASATLLEFASNDLGGQPGITAVLHTWSQTLLDHYHLHCIVTGGALAPDGRWKAKSAHWLFPVKALSKVFRAKYRDGLRALFAAGSLGFHGQLATLARANIFHRMLNEVCRQPWVVFSKRPFAGPQTVLAYLARYTHRVGIHDSRILSIDEATVAFRYKDYADRSRSKRMTLALDEFTRRFRLHILPARFVKIRHYGLLSTRNRRARIAQARAALSKRPSKTILPPPQSADPAPPICPHCQQSKLVLIQITRPPRTRTPTVCDSS